LTRLMRKPGVCRKGDRLLLNRRIDDDLRKRCSDPTYKLFAKAASLIS
jgi:hypothetical protein